METKDLNRLKVVLAEKGGAARLTSVSWRVPAHEQVACRTTWQRPCHYLQMVYQQCAADTGELVRHSQMPGRNGK